MFAARTRCLILGAILIAPTCLAQRVHVGVLAIDESACAAGVPAPPLDLDLIGIRVTAAPSSPVIHHLVASPSPRSSIAWAPTSGAYQAIDANLPGFSPSSDRMEVVATYRRPGDDPAEHAGFMSLGISQAPELWQDLRILREVPTPSVTMAGGLNELAWPSVSNDGFFDCPGPVTQALPRLSGYELYRLDGVSAAVSTPLHYLCGPDLDCATTGDNGWIAFVPDAPAADGIVRYTDPSGRMDSTYVIQPVLAGQLMGSRDFDGDGFPELIDPQGGGALGLTAWAGGPARVILTSRDAGLATAADALMKLFKLSAPSFRVDWTETGVATRRDLYGGDLVALGAPPPTYAHDDQIACALPAPVGGLGSQVTSDAAPGNRYYLLAVTSTAGTSYGADSEGRPRPPSGNPCP